MSKRKTRNASPSKFVTHAECAAISDSIKTELKTIKVTLIGEDMRGGLVKDLQKLNPQQASLKQFCFL